MSSGPLDDPRLRQVEAALDDGRLDEAERLLAALDYKGPQRQGANYLTTRLLYQRQRLSETEVAQRMRQVLHSMHDFPQARALLDEAERGTLSPRSRFSTSAPQSGAAPTTGIPGPPGLPQFARTEPELPSPSTFPGESEFSLDPIPEAARRSSQPSRSTSPSRPAHSNRFDRGEFEEDDFDSQAAPHARRPSSPHRSSLPPPGLDSTPEAGLELSEFEHSEWPAATPSYLAPQAQPRVSIRVRDPAEPHTPTDPVPQHAKAVATTDRVPQYAASVAMTDPAMAMPRFETNNQSLADLIDDEPLFDDELIDETPDFGVDQTPSMFSVLTLLDEHRYTEALAALSASDNRDSPEFTLMRARALRGSGRQHEASELLEQMCETAGLGPELRAGCARLLLEVGEPELALEQAQLALRVARDSPAVVLTTAWALLRVARRDQDEDKRDAASQLLTELEASGGPAPALASALWASIWSETGKPAEALKSARRALELDPDSIEALVGLATAHAALGEREEAARVWRQLLGLSQDEALILRPRLIQLGARIERVSPSLIPTAAEPVSRRVWDPLETALVSGECAALLEAWERTARELIGSFPLATTDLTELGHKAAATLAQMSALCHFGPYDLSLWSLFRLQVALDLVLTQTPPEAELTNTKLLLGAYMGETVRHAYSGSWQGSLTSGDAWVSARGSTLHPFLQIDNRIQRGVNLTLDDFAPLEFAHGAYIEWQASIPNDSAPPKPWSPDAWPSLEELGSVGRALGRSVVGMYCERFGAQPLDHTTGSLPALDSYLTLIAPPTGPRQGASPSLTRAAIIAGAYVGEVIRLQLGGEWESGDPGDARAYRLRVGSHPLHPVEQMLARLLGESKTTATEYVERIARYPQPRY